MNCEDIARLCPLYLTGELEAASVLHYREHLQACYVCAGQVEQLARLDAILRSSVLSEEIDNAAFDQRVRRVIASQRPVFSRRRIAAAAGIAALLLTAVMSYRALFDLESARLCAAAAQDHQNEVSRRQPRKWLSDPRAIAELAQLNGVSESLLTKLAPAGYTLKQGKLCRLNGDIFLHLVYAQGGREVSTYLRPVKETVVSRFIHSSEIGHEYVAYVQADQLSALFVTDESSKAAMSVARSAARVL